VELARNLSSSESAKGKSKKGRAAVVVENCFVNPQPLSASLSPVIQFQTFHANLGMHSFSCFWLFHSLFLIYFFLIYFVILHVWDDSLLSVSDVSPVVRPRDSEHADFVEHFVIFNNALLTSFETNQKATKRHPLPSDQAMAIADSFTISLVDGVEVEKRRENKGPKEKPPEEEPKPQPPPEPKKKPKALAEYVDPFTAYSLGIEKDEVSKVDLPKKCMQSER
jgi:hypothetical protein